MAYNVIITQTTVAIRSYIPLICFHASCNSKLRAGWSGHRSQPTLYTMCEYSIEQSAVICLKY